MNYTIYRKKIKNFIIRIYPDKTIKISVPLRATNNDIEKFINSKMDWINKVLINLEDKLENIDKNKIKILGILREKRYIKSELNMIRLSEKSLYIYYKEENFENIDVLIEEWKEKYLNDIIKEILDKYLKVLNITIKCYKLKKLNSAWGIYHTRNNYITFNKDLIEKEKSCIDYVVLHELCHIFHPNHQKEFWAMVEKYMPNYKHNIRLLKQ